MDNAALFQRTIKENNDDLQDFLESMKSWEDEIKKKDELLSKQKPILKKAIPPIRNKIDSKKQIEKEPPLSTSSDTKSRISSYDYRAWDKFDVDKACEESDNDLSSDHEEEEEEEYSQQQNQQKAMIEKEKGNTLFSQHKYEAAIERYTQAMGLDPMSAVLPANRAMALLKMNRFAAAEQDCSAALSLDPTYTKALFRRATARTKLKKHKDAIHDLQELLKLEPDNKVAKAELDRVSSVANQSAEESSQSAPKEELQGLVLPVNRPTYMRSKKPLKTVLIEEIGSPPPLAISPTVSKDAVTAVRDMPSTEKTAQESPVAVGKDTASSTTEHTKKDLTSDSSISAEIITPLSSSSSIQDLPGVPSSSTVFIHDWKRLQSHPELLSKYFQLIPLDKYSAILSQSLETDVFPGIINILFNHYVKCGRACVRELQALTKVQRFSVAVMFLSSKDKTVLNEMFAELQSLVKDKPLLQQLAKLYKVSSL